MRPQLSKLRRPNPYQNHRNLVRIKRSNKLLEATALPIVVTLNPRSLYNKHQNFHTLIDQTEAGICFVSERKCDICL